VRETYCDLFIDLHDAYMEPSFCKVFQEITYLTQLLARHPFFGYELIFTPESRLPAAR
jgi:hypothetical protein